jgi:hypothetical protein
MDLYLKAADEAEMNAALIDAGVAYDDEGVLTPAPFVSLDVIGAIPERDGYHVNVRSYDLTEAQLAELQPVIIVPPEQPYRVWA